MPVPAPRKKTGVEGNLRLFRKDREVPKFFDPVSRNDKIVYDEQDFLDQRAVLAENETLIYMRTTELKDDNQFVSRVLELYPDTKTVECLNWHHVTSAKIQTYFENVDSRSDFVAAFTCEGNKADGQEDFETFGQKWSAEFEYLSSKMDGPDSGRAVALHKTDISTGTTLQHFSV